MSKAGNIYEYNNIWVDKATKLTKGQRKILINWLSNQPEGVQVDAIRLMKKNVIRNKSQLNNETYAELYYSALVVVLNKMKIIETTKAHKRGMEPDKGRKMTDIKIARIKEERTRSRNAKKRDMISLYFAEINQLRNKGLSWREVEKYFLKFHHKQISYAYIQQEFNRISNCKM
ncbi:hypothetical protein MHK_010370 [Candidatus Magnetomorum sp. HK-1]|nr:hypothetical protein MHK_010370 [Candidatus Magnetomorum sp. HK-1]